ncbi:MAG: hypothetical protein O7H40_15730 [Gammaproteobacteria bacterium]|nr:hypothetical protein [Gammaproteobacteria bacterium]
MRQKGAKVIGFDRTDRDDNVDEFHRVELTDYSDENSPIDGAIAAMDTKADGLCNIAGLPNKGRSPKSDHRMAAEAMQFSWR